MASVIVMYEIADRGADELARTLYWDARLLLEPAYDDEACQMTAMVIRDSGSNEYREPVFP